MHSYCHRCRHTCTCQQLQHAMHGTKLSPAAQAVSAGERSCKAEAGAYAMCSSGRARMFQHHGCCAWTTAGLKRCKLRVHARVELPPLMEPAEARQHHICLEFTESHRAKRHTCQILSREHRKKDFSRLRSRGYTMQLALDQPSIAVVHG